VSENLPTAADLRESDTEQVNAVYRERNQFPSGLAHLWPTVLTPATDYVGTWIVYLESPAGQLSWHIMPEDLDLFEHVDRRETYPYDGHTTEEKYARLTLALRMEGERLRGMP